MSRGWLLGGHWYNHVMNLTSLPSCAWHLVRRGEQDGIHLLQLWLPRPPDKELDHLREGYLQRVVKAEKYDPPQGAFGHNAHCAWFFDPLLREIRITLLT